MDIDNDGIEVMIMSFTIGKFKEDYQINDVCDVYPGNDRICISGLVIDSEIPLMSKSGSCCVWKFNLKNKMQIMKCCMFIRPEDKNIGVSLDKSEVVVQGYIYKNNDDVQFNVHGLEVLELPK